MKCLFENFELAVIVRLDSNTLDIEHDMILLCSYIPPEGSVYYKSDENGIDILHDKMEEISSKYPNDYWCLIGDYNARTGTKLDFIEFDDDCTPGIDFYGGDKFNQRIILLMSMEWH